MKSTFRKFAFLAGAALFPAFVFAQSDEIKVRIIKEVDGKQQIIEKTIDAKNMSAADREKIISQAQDTLKGKPNKNTKVQVMIEDRREIRREKGSGSREMIIEKGGDFRHHQMDEKDAKSIEENADFNDEKGKRPRRMIYQRIEGDEPNGQEKHVQVFVHPDRRNFDWQARGENNSSIGYVWVRANKPNSEVLNVHFSSKDKASVTITAVDAKGKTLAQEQLQNFSGEYMGQLNLPKGTKGTVFVLISNDIDAEITRVNLP